MQFVMGAYRKPENIFIGKTKFDSIDDKFLCFLFGTFFDILFDALFNDPVN